MLCGTYLYKGHSYNVEMYDFGDSMAAHLIPFTNKDRIFLDAGTRGVDFRVPAQWDKLYVSVGIGAISASKYITEDTDEEGNVVKYTNLLNSGALV